MVRDGAHHLVFFSDCAYYAGAEAYVGMLAEAAPANWRLSAMTPEGKAGEGLARRWEKAGVQVARFRPPSWSHPGGWSAIDRQLRSFGGDRLHLNLPSVYDSAYSIPAFLAKRAGYRRVVTTEHLPMVLRARRRMLVKMLTTTAVDAVIVHTAWNRERLAHYHHVPLKKIVIIPNGSAEAPALSREERDRLRAQWGAGAHTRVAAVVARLTERKGHRVLFEALATHALPEWRLWVVGEGEEEGALREQARRLGLADRVDFLGFQENAREIIHACDLLVLPSMMETQPLVITEAMASARPVIATAIYGIPEIVADGVTGCLVPPNEAAPLAQAIGRLLADRDLAERMGRAGRERYERHFTLARMAERTYRVIAGGDPGWESSVSGEAGRTVEQAAREAGRTTEAAAGGVETGRAR